MSTHGAETLVMKKEHAYGSIFSRGFCENTGIHIGMTSRFPDDGLSKMIEVILSIPPLFQDSGTGDLRHALCDDPQRLASCVSVYGFYHGPFRWRLPIPFICHDFTPAQIFFVDWEAS
jgi:hypothetical protein